MVAISITEEAYARDGAGRGCVAPGLGVSRGHRPWERVGRLSSSWIVRVVPLFFRGLVSAVRMAGQDGEIDSGWPLFAHSGRKPELT
jgi:hypothetical protein